MDEKKKKLAWRALLSRRNLFLIAVANLILSLVNVWSTHNLLMKSSSSSSSSSSESYFLTSFFENEDVNRIKSSSVISQRVPSILDSRLHPNIKKEREIRTRPRTRTTEMILKKILFLLRNFVLREQMTVVTVTIKLITTIIIKMVPFRN